MQITIPQTQAQKDFENKIQNLITILAEMSVTDVQKVLEYAIFIAN